MDDIIDSRLFISSLEVARDLNILKDRNISAIVCIGCEPTFPDLFGYCSYPLYLDMPETNLLPVFFETTRFIQSKMEKDENILVHCVYGQSRSASIIAAYLILNLGYTVSSAVLCIKERHSDTCINPGFLSQLHLLSTRLVNRVEFNLACSLNLDKEHDVLDSSIEETFINCKTCNSMVESIQNILSCREGEEEFIQEHLDSFWADYKSPHKNSALKLPAIGYLFMAPLRQDHECPIRWTPVAKRQKHVDSRRKTKQSDKDSTQESPRLENIEEYSLECRLCSSSIGIYRNKGLAVCGGFVLANMYAFFSDKVIIASVCDQTATVAL